MLGANASKPKYLAVRFALVFSVAATSLGVGCDARTDKDAKRRRDTATAQTGSSTVHEPPQPPKVLYLPEGDVDMAVGSENAWPVPFEPVAPNPPVQRCPPDMVDIKGSYCIDRYEAHLVDRMTGEALSPYYPPAGKHARQLHDYWEKERATAASSEGASLAVPRVPEFQVEGRVEPLAVSKGNVTPSGYLDGIEAERACKNAGKRLCTTSEWVTACRGEQNRPFPYGDTYAQGACNVFREAHPAAILHGNASEGHLDPRLNLVKGPSGPLLRKTGATSTCRSVWGNDGVFDMVGNLDEWVEDENGAFQGGFYARATKAGCEARITSHPRAYEDYSLGVRCCR
jgi:formylglycine-generating enzyme required for sulfatase activity